MSEFRIGAKKATALLKYLDGEPAGGDETKAAQSDREANSVRLHVVPETVESDRTAASPAPIDAPTLPSAVPATQESAELGHEPDQTSGSATPEVTAAADASGQVKASANPGTGPEAEGRPAVRVPASWPVLLLALPAFVAIWSGWVGLGSLTGFGMVRPLPGIADWFAINTAITLPIGVETYAAYALRVWLSGAVPSQARRFAKWSALGSLALGALGQIAYHLMTAAGVTHAPWWITTVVSCLPVAVLGMGAALTHLLHTPSSDVPTATDGEARR
ncbi:ABC transporter permease [Saccharopolyspora sp. NPDC049426]|uniref:ABC transporter permease n=1 Tax=Saccharopolyspora sp. NPDC049426 TaxID=3155652 RepID=UPI00343122CC